MVCGSVLLAFSCGKSLLFIVRFLIDLLSGSAAAP
jgi:hypothetical protein